MLDIQVIEKKSSNKSHNTKLLIFDLDGTLIDSLPDITRAVNAMLDRHVELAHIKQTFNNDRIRNWIGNGSLILIERVLEYLNSADDVDTMHDLFLEKYAQINSENTVPYHGVQEGLLQLKQQGYELALVTNKPYQFVPHIIDKFSWNELFSVILGGDSLEKKKPDPSPLLYVCEKLNYNVSDAIMIGDSKNDILAGRNADIETIGLSYGYNYGQDINDFSPTHSFDDFDSMVKFLLNTELVN